MGYKYTTEDRLQLMEERGIIYDEADRELLEKHTWSIGNHGYAFTTWKVDGRTVTQLLHRFLFANIPDNFVVDHINQNKLDNRRANLRLVSQSDNMKNSKKAKEGSVVYIHKYKHFRGTINIGTFVDEDEAALEVEAVLALLRKNQYEFPHERRYNVAEKP